jgi:hypothetical protein
MATNGADDNGLFHIGFFTPESDVTWWLKYLAKANADGKPALDLTALPVSDVPPTEQSEEISLVRHQQNPRFVRPLPAKGSQGVGELRWGTGLRIAFRLFHKHDQVRREQIIDEMVKEGLHPSNVSYVLGQFAKRGWVEQVDHRIYAKTSEMPSKIGEN